MLDFLGKVPDVGWAALISSVATAVTLMVQTYLTNRRDDRRRAEDRTFRLAETEAARRAALADGWRHERRRVHELLLTSLGGYRARAREVLTWATVGSNGRLEAARHLAAPDGSIDIASKEEREELEERLAAVRLLASTKAGEAAERAVGLMLDLQGAVWISSAILASSSSRKSPPKLRSELGECDAAINSYIDAVRLELETVD